MDKYIGYMNTQTPQADNAPDVEIADRIMHTMIVKGTNLKELSAETGIPYSTLRRSLHQTRPDRRSFSFKEFHKISAALTVKPSTLLPADLVKA